MLFSNELLALADKYQQFTRTTAVYPGACTGNKEELAYLILGIQGEEYEWFDSGYSIDEARDILWYVSRLAEWNSSTLSRIFLKSLPAHMIKPNINEAAKKVLRDNKDIGEILDKYLITVVSHIMYRYHYSMNNPAVDATFKTILMKNTDKLTDRRNRGVLKGDGDSR